MLLVATPVEIPETIQTEQQAEIPEKTPVATQVEIVVTPVVIQVETPGTAQVELPVVPPEAEQPSRFSLRCCRELCSLQHTHLS